MTAFWFGLVLLTGLCSCDADQTGGPRWNQAVDAYRQGDYETAYVRFQDLLSDPRLAEGPTLYNLGNCSYRLGRFLDAALHYRRALLHMPADPEATFNLKLTERRLGKEPPVRSFGATVLSWVDRLNPRVLLVLCAVLQGIGLIGMARMHRGRWFRVAMALCLLLGISGALRLGQTRFFPGPPAAMVLAGEAAVRSEPHTSFGITLKLEAGDIVQIAEMSDRWARIIHPQGTGWTERDSLGLIE